VELNLGSLTLLDEGGFVPGAVARIDRRDGDGSLNVIVEGASAIRLPRDLSDRLFVGAP
jgi:hypothetical protein